METGEFCSVYWVHSDDRIRRLLRRERLRNTLMSDNNNDQENETTEGDQLNQNGQQDNETESGIDNQAPLPAKFLLSQVIQPQPRNSPQTGTTLGLYPLLMPSLNSSENEFECDLRRNIQRVVRNEYLIQVHFWPQWT